MSSYLILKPIYQSLNTTSIPIISITAQETTSLEASAPFEDVSLDNLTGTDRRETREKLSRLNFLLKASGIYSQIIAQNVSFSTRIRDLIIFARRLRHPPCPPELT